MRNIRSLQLSIVTRLKTFIKDSWVEKRLALWLAITVVVSCFTTYAVISSNPPLGPDPQTVILLLCINLILLLVFGLVVAKQVIEAWHRHKQNIAGAGLHVKLAITFTLAAAIPTIVVTIFSVTFFHLGIENWFSKRVSTAVQESRQVALSYLQEHKKAIQGEALAMAYDYSRFQHRLMANKKLLFTFINEQAEQRDLSEAILFDSSSKVLASSRLSWSLDFALLPKTALDEARAKGIAIYTTENEDRVRAVVRLDGYVERFLYIARYVNPMVHDHVVRTEEAAIAYETMLGQSNYVEVTFAIVFIVVALLFLLASMWAGLRFATYLVTPITRLIEAADKVSQGDYDVRVARADKQDPLGILSKTFNNMTGQLNEQRIELEQRQKFTEAVLEGVSAGVIGLDSEARIHLPNKRASLLLATDLTEELEKPLNEIVPELAEFLEEALSSPELRHTTQIKVSRGGKILTLNVTIVAEGAKDPRQEYVVTFDDISELVSAQRQAAWADVARRVAHEIKNPLTPIQLSAERLKKRYTKEVSDQDTFTLCTETIIRQVGDIGRLVDEFSSFARMPAPQIKLFDLKRVVEEAVFLAQNAAPEIEFKVDLPRGPVSLKADAGQIRQVVQNIVKNAIQAIKSVKDQFRGLSSSDKHAMVWISLTQGLDEILLVINDNGPGFPTDGRDALIQPYVTFHPDGSGLGLAIVNKIMEDHGGELILGDSDEGGASVTLRFVLQEKMAI